MGVEAIGSAISSAAGAVGRTGGSLSRGLEAFGPSIGPVNLPINEGLGPRLENTMPIIQVQQLNSLGPSVPVEPAVPDVGGRNQPFWRLDSTITLASNPTLIGQEIKPEPVTAPEPLANKVVPEPQAAYWFTDVPEPEVKPAEMILPVIIEDSAATESVIQAKNALGLQVTSRVEAKSRRSSLVVPNIASQPALQEQVVEEETVETENTERLRDLIGEEVEEFKLGHSVDREAAAVRVEEIIAAAKEVEAEIVSAGKVVTIVDGSRIAERLPGQHNQNKGQEILQQGPDLIDGTLDFMKARLVRLRFRNQEEVVKKAPEIVAEDNPVKRGLGLPVGDEDLAKTYIHYPQKIHPAVRIFRRRVLKHGNTAKPSLPPRVVPSYFEEVIEQGEGTIEDYPGLAGVFQRVV